MLTEEYKEQLQELHSDPILKWGNDGKLHVEQVKQIIRSVGAKTMLDFGCGRGSLKKKLKDMGLIIKEFDPGQPKKSNLPAGRFDLITCTDVMEHVEPEFVDLVLQTIAERTLKAAYFIIDCVPAKQMLPDGRNAHLTIAPPEEWVKRIEKAFVNEGLEGLGTLTVRIPENRKKLEMLVVNGLNV